MTLPGSSSKRRRAIVSRRAVSARASSASDARPATPRRLRLTSAAYMPALARAQTLGAAAIFVHSEQLRSFCDFIRREEIGFGPPVDQIKHAQGVLEFRSRK
jgi:hypothetical protein